MRDIIIFSIEATPLCGVTLFAKEVAYFFPGAGADVFKDDERWTVFVDPF